MPRRDLAGAARALEPPHERVEGEEALNELGDLSSGARYRGGVDDWTRGALSGWAIDLAEPLRPLKVAFETMGSRYGEVVTAAPAGPDAPARFTLDLAAMPEMARGELEAALGATSPHALVDPSILTLRLDDEGPRIDLGRNGVTVRQALAQCTHARAAAQAPEPIRRDASTPRYIAGIDGVFEMALRGWAIDLSELRAPVGLFLEVRGAEILAFKTCEHRDDIGSVLEGNVAGFSIDLALLPESGKAAIAEALANAEPTALAPPGVVALRVEADGSLIDLGAFGVTAGELLAGIGRGPSVAKSAAPAAKPRAAARSREASALHWLLAYLGAEDGQASPTRKFAARLLAELEGAATVSRAVKRHAAEIAPLFDPFYYLERLASPQEALANPLLHYALAGWRDGASPHPLFAPDYYRRLRGALEGDPLLDFVRAGAALGVDPHPLFDLKFYRERHLSGEAEVNPLVHYLETGGRQRLDPSPLFDTERYLKAFGLGAEIDNPLESFVVTPAHYGYALTPGFDAALYRYQIEVERGERLDEPPYAHYASRGFRDETLLPNLLFDPAFYRERNKLDLAEPALVHYLREGEAAGLPCHAMFWPEFYNRERGESGSALEHALAHPGEIRSDPRMDGPIDPRLFAFVRNLVAEGGLEAFRLEIYRDANPDTVGMNDRTAEAHYRVRGAREHRIASLTRVMRLADMRVRDLPLGFVLDDYVSIYPDLKNFAGRFTSALFHYGRCGRQEKRLIGKWLFRIADLEIDLPTASAPLRVAARAQRIDVCILIHAFYPDLLPELTAFAQNFRDVSFDIFINVVDLAWTPALQQELRAICPGAFVLLSNDNGRDIGGFTRLLAHVDIARYDLFAFMHSKKSPHIAPESGEYWRRALLRAIAGSPETARECVKLMREAPHIGMIGAKEWRSHDMGKNIEQYEKLLDLLGVRGKNRELDYISGFMFLIRADIVARLYETLRHLDFEYGGDQDLDFHIDGQIAHGVERATPALVRQMGYEVHYR